MDRADRPDRAKHRPSDRRIDRRLDARGLRCPEPLLRVRLVLRGMTPGQWLELLTDDPLAGVDLRVFCERTGHRLIGPQPCAGAEVWVIEVDAAAATDGSSAA